MSRKPLSVATVIEKNRISSDVAFLICLDIDVIDPTMNAVVETLHVVNNTENITFNGFVYTAAKFEIETSQAAGVQAPVSLSMNDYTGSIQQRMEAYGGGVGFLVQMSVVNSGNLLQPPEIVEEFEVVSAGSQDYIVTFQLGAENALAKMFPARRQFKDFCTRQYKNPVDCKYAGPLATCSYTLQGDNGCKAHNNVINFGAYPGLVSTGNRYV